MKKMLSTLLITCVAFLAASSAVADAAYPYNTPVYVPTAYAPLANYTAPTDFLVTLQNAGILGVDINGTCTSLAGVIQVSVDGVTWRTVNVYPVVTGTITVAAAISAAGAYRANVSGARLARVHVTALTATCNIAAVATSSSPSLVQ